VDLDIAVHRAATAIANLYRLADLEQSLAINLSMKWAEFSAAGIC
jgi:hypothetical protein